jgi:hypothetical protein
MKRPESTKCHYCYRSLTKYEITLDHKTPRSAGGTAARSNIVFACALCNLCKGSAPHAIFLIQIALVPIDPTVVLAYQSIRSHYRRWLRAVRALHLFGVDTPTSAVAAFSTPPCSATGGVEQKR